MTCCITMSMVMICVCASGTCIMTARRHFLTGLIILFAILPLATAERGAEQQLDPIVHCVGGRRHLTPRPSTSKRRDVVIAPMIRAGGGSSEQRRPVSWGDTCFFRRTDPDGPRYGRRTTDRLVETPWGGRSRKRRAEHDWKLGERRRYRREGQQSHRTRATFERRHDELYAD